MVTSRVQDGREAIRDITLSDWQDVRVDIQRCAAAAVSEPRLHDVSRHASGQVRYQTLNAPRIPRIRELRRERGMSLVTLAAASGVPVSTLSRIERGL